MSDGGGFNWNLGLPPKKDEPAAEQPPVTKYPATERQPPAAPPTAPPAAPPTSAADQPTQAYTWGQPTAPYTPPVEQYRPAVQPTPQPTPPPAAPPTQGDPWDQPTQAYAFDSSLGGPTELLGATPIGLPELRDEGLRTQPSSAIDSLFGESQFKEYEATAFPVEAPGGPALARPREPRVPMGRTQRILFWVAGGLVAVILLVAIFVLGRSMPGLIPEPEAEAPAPVATTAPVAAAPLVGPVAPGEYDWDQLLGTECLEPFTSAWDETYTVVDCTAPHSAQLTYRGMFGDESFAPYPGAAELQARINLLCTTPTSVNYAVAGGLDDIAVSASYAASEEEWDAGERQYYCFLTRSSGEPFTVSVANVPAVDPAPVASIPSSDP